jgi:hypothetical protein
MRGIGEPPKGGALVLHGGEEVGLSLKGEFVYSHLKYCEDIESRYQKAVKEANRMPRKC